MNDIEVYNENTKIAGKEDINVYMAQEYISYSQPIPAIYFPGADGPLGFYQTRESLADADRYRAFITNCIRRFRKSRAYKGYKAYLMSMGLDRCQINGNIQDGMADIEMHHNFLTIYDITILISQHLLNTVGKCTTFDIVELLIQEHRDNNIPIVMISETVHQLYHSNPDMYIPISMTFGKWWDLLIRYRYGITLDIASKVVKYIQNCQRNNELRTQEFYQISSDIESWGNYNEYNYYNNYSGYLINTNSGSNSEPHYEFNTLVGIGQPDYRTENGTGQIFTETQIYGAGF